MVGGEGDDQLWENNNEFCLALLANITLFSTLITQKLVLAIWGLCWYYLSGVVKCPDMIHDDIHVYVNIKCFFPGIEICGRPSIWWFQLSWKIILYLSWIISQNFGAKTKQSLKPPVSYFKNHVKYSAYFGELFSLPNSCFCFLAPNSSLVPPPGDLQSNGVLWGHLVLPLGAWKFLTFFLRDTHLWCNKIR